MWVEVNVNTNTNVRRRERSAVVIVNTGVTVIVMLNDMVTLVYQHEKCGEEVYVEYERVMQRMWG